ncbi:hypothetical protein ACA30_01345 [Virgibacillus soli]|uniref:LamG-like jellyroll fold domain-containing protein n=1 Tax=Lederbergia galactosidilytica TaxID=217031 RepID=UPI000714CE5D|nr:LamG-like jellyroll fold domain-containing protein [Lederbergia galactosidilytica]KRG16379.1 hypothetical protein ACA30_01345 [Virgibacillus soli]MBP1914301.1 hypothetical protein [Lederbergia galactosidilytica]
MAIESPAYLIAYFRSGPMQTNKNERLHYAYSRDGLHWYELNQNHAVWSTSIGEGILRDPFINKGKDGFWHLVFTIRPKGKFLGYAKSKDLITWQDEKAIEVMTNYHNVQNSWAPEFSYDPEEEDYLLYWASSVGEDMSHNKHYCCRTSDWDTFSETTLFFDPGFQTIDASIEQWNGTNYMFVKDESAVYDSKKRPQPIANKLAVSADLSGPYEVISDFITPNYTEGPEILKIENKQKWLLIYDYWKYGRFGIKESTNLVDWSDELDSTKYRFPYQIRHATVFPLGEDELFQLMNHFSLEAYYPTVFHSYVSLATHSSSGFMHNEFYMRSVSMWFKADTIVGTQVLYDEGGDKSGLGIRIKGGKLEAAVRSNGNQLTVSAESLETNKWYNVIVVFNEGNLNLYIDGKLAETNSFQSPFIENHPNPGGLGARFDTDAFGESAGKAIFNGIFRDCRIYTVPLQEEDVDYLFWTERR